MIRTYVEQAPEPAVIPDAPEMSVEVCHYVVAVRSMIFTDTNVLILLMLVVCVIANLMGYDVICGVLRAWLATFNAQTELRRLCCAIS